jgi:hypothetical protein
MCTVAAGSWGGRRLDDYVTGRGPRTGRPPPPEGAVLATLSREQIEPVLPDNRETQPLTGDSSWDSVLQALYLSGGRTICGLAGSNAVSQRQL